MNPVRLNLVEAVILVGAIGFLCGYIRPYWLGITLAIVVSAPIGIMLGYRRARALAAKRRAEWARKNL